ncbi:MAG: thermonuclease family protein [Thiobacillus sp.]|jgi:endonuclease YncB( thermonuclease family)|nr:thermonuclease family protein [Thiobacillus sp.]
MKNTFARILFLLAWLTATSAWSTTMSGVVFVVIDGDTVLFKPDHVPAASRAFLKIRLADIDAPEKEQPHGEASTHMLTDLVLNKHVEVDIVATDIYGRSIARIQMGALQVNAEMVRRGAAWASTRARSDTDLVDAQMEARRAHLGLWQTADPTPPWEWRRVFNTP